MKKVTVVLAHDNFENSIANQTIIKELKEVDQLEIRNIYELYSDYKIDVEAEQKALIDTDIIIFQFPFYWYSAPAILKAYIDQVFAFNFAYGPEGNKLEGKEFLISTTIGGPAEAYTPTGYNHFRIEQLLLPFEQTAYLAKMNYHQPIYEHRMVYVPGVYNTKESVENNAIRQAERLKEQINNFRQEEIEMNTLIHEFVAEWFGNFDKLAENGFFINHLDGKVIFKFPEGEYEGHAGFANWYDSIKETIKADNKHMVEIKSIKRDGGFYRVALEVEIDAETNSGEALKMKVKEDWKLTIGQDKHIHLHEYFVEKIG
ncbi:NAD(P)H-dependent oxidoreductase [Sediminitomix flava]|nr:NAD(P)H-dependent oxidoreductase [Sediminitomix flava]